MRKPSSAAVLGAFVLLVLVLIEWRPWHSLTEDKSVEVESSLSKNEAVIDDNAGLGDQSIRAQLSPVTYTTVASELAAKVDKFDFREGESFKAGQTLVTFDCKTQQAQFQKSKASMMIAERNYVTNKKLLDLGSVGRIEYENSQSEYQKAKAEADELGAVVAKCKILAPFNGRVAEQKVRAQQFVQAGQPLLDILDNSALELEFIVPSKWSTWLVNGYDFQVKVDETGKSYPAKITRVGARIDPVSQTFKVAAIVNGEFAELTPGMSGTVEIKSPSDTPDKQVTQQGVVK
ncbi:efflux RND transporter periplasmic adaptor subunit [Polynucleobacter sp. JS-JIR-II-50]|uniref:efflux RND transporter periplasmic adaptor subunit n=1 Tax=Polynucleobacter sp. JS-JIR-II-50 TaxID=2576919 RepID=UPI001BFE79E3|nr:efflux RND transporter periplasmic adaptor subunit [Polynucleobacter sp. JS-JIR-II-50]QWE03740.1 efflux RND transporter periplasmic adaptor subunit [Polynucleobacter sp. JS-JIR-II-50]